MRYQASAGRSATALDIMAGVPGRRGEVRPLQGVRGSQTTFKPASGEHFYYVRVVQDDGRMLWSAPVWISQRE